MNQAWSDCWTNTALVSFTTVLIMLCLKYFIAVADILINSLTRWKLHIELEHNLSLARNRNRAFMIVSLPFAMIVDRYGLYPNPIVDMIPRMWTVFVQMGFFWVYMLIRQIFWLCIHPRKMDQEQRLAMHRVFNNLFIMMVPVMLACVGLLGFAGVSDRAMRIVLYSIAGIFVLIDWINVFHFLAQHRFRFLTFLYLCALEIIPLCIMIAPVVILRIC